MNSLHGIAFILVIIGGLNWLLVGLLQWDISALLGGMDSGLSRLVYILVGLSAIWLLAKHKTDCKWCAGGNPTTPAPINK